MKIKKLLVFLLFGVLLFSLTACDPEIEYCYYEYFIEEEIKEVKLVRIDNDDYEVFLNGYSDHSDEIKDLDMSTLSVISILPECDLEMFERALRVCEVAMDYYLYDSAAALSIMVIYDSGTFDIIGEDYICRYSSTGEVVKYIGIFTSYAYTDFLYFVFFEESGDDTSTIV